MTPANEPTRHAPSAHPSPHGNWRASLFQAISLILSLAAAGGVLFFLTRVPPPGHSAEDGDSKDAEEPVQLDAAGRIVIRAGTPLAEKLATRKPDRETVSLPLLTVTGYVVARRGPGKNPSEARWDFNTPETANAHADWLKAQLDLDFNKKQLETIRKLNKSLIDAQTEVVERMENLVKAGTDTVKDLVKEKAELRRITIQAQKDDHDWDTAYRNAERTLRTLERQLYQAGASPDLLARAALGAAIVVADVPEARVALVRPKQSCQARFFAAPGKVFDGRVESIAPVLSKERRTLRIFFEVQDPEVQDPKAQLKPGMFAEVGVGTDERTVLFVPSDAILHVGRADYVLFEEKPNVLRIGTIQAGESYNARVEVLSGVKPTDKIVVRGAILLKPLVVRALQTEKTREESKTP